jgi:predicted metal-dependent peptidase
MPTPNEIRDLVEQDRFELMMRCPFYGRIICSMELVVVSDPQVRLACTDYRRIFISGNAYSALPEEKRLAVLAHEVLHIALRHAFRIGDRDKNRFEKAADIEVACVLVESFPDPYGINDYDEWMNLTAEQIYELLPPRENKTKAKSDHCSPNDAISGEPLTKDKSTSSEDDSKPDGRDDRGNNNDKSEDQGSESKSKTSKSKRSNTGDESGDDDGEGNGGEGSSDGGGSDDGDGGSGDGKQAPLSEFRPMFDAETEMNCIALSSEMLMDMKMSGSGFGKGIGSAPGALERLLNKLNAPRVNWQVLLRQFLRLCRGGSYSWMRTNRRFISRGLYLPGRQTKSFSGIVALDTSPSTYGDLPKFASELMGLLKSFGKFDIRVIECACSILQVWTVSSSDPMTDLTQHQFKVGGGTDFTPVFEYIRDHHLTPNVLIYFTDGHGSCPKRKPPYPVLWMLTRGGIAPVPWGQVIYYEES